MATRVRNRYRIEELSDGKVIRTSYRHTIATPSTVREWYPGCRVTMIEAHECGCEEDMYITHAAESV